jgi:hypothetical protein
MNLLRVFVALALLVVVAIGSDTWRRHSQAQHLRQTLGERPLDAAAVLDPMLQFRRPADEAPVMPRVDVHGNPVDNAVGEYRVDRGGEMYERHSPDTALLHLGSPRL